MNGQHSSCRFERRKQWEILPSHRDEVKPSDSLCFNFHLHRKEGFHSRFIRSRLDQGIIINYYFKSSSEWEVFKGMLKHHHHHHHRRRDASPEEPCYCLNKIYRSRPLWSTLMSFTVMTYDSAWGSNIAWLIWKSQLMRWWMERLFANSKSAFN